MQHDVHFVNDGPIWSQIQNKARIDAYLRCRSVCSVLKLSGSNRLLRPISLLLQKDGAGQDANLKA